jgi:hypothetical protein
MTDTSIDWVPLDVRKWVAGTSELDADAEYVFFRLCLLAYETGSAVLDRSARRLAAWCKRDLDRYESSLEFLLEIGKVERRELGLFVPSAARRIDEALSKISARQVGAAKSRRIGVLKREGKTQAQIEQIISEEFPEHQGQKPTEKKRTQKKTLEERTLEGFLGEGADAPERSQADIAFDLYNETADRAQLPRAQVFTDGRKSKLKLRLKEAGGLEGWKIALAKVEASPFLTGRRQDFKADLDFMLQKASFVKIMEGRYDAVTAERASGVMEALRGMANE